MGSEHPEWLPLDWKVSVKIRNFGRKDKYYIHPSTGLKFNSKPEVLRYLESSQKSFNSKVLNKSSAEAKEQRSIDKTNDKNVADRESIKSGPDAAAPKNIENPLVEERQREDDSVVDKRKKKLPQANVKERENGGRRRSMRLANNNPEGDAKEYLPQSGSETAENNMNIPQSKGLEHKEKENGCTEETVQHENPAPQNKRETRKRKWMNNTPRRTSKRLASLEVDQPVEVKNSNKDGASAKLLSEGEVDSIKNASTFSKSDEPETLKSCATNSHKQKEAITHEKICGEEQKSIDAVNQEDQKHLDSTLKEILMDPCIEFAIKTLTGAIPIEDITKSDSNLVSSSNQTSSCSPLSPCSDIWSDPCFEFAVKTLTGEMPTEDSLQVDKPVSSSGGSVCPSNYPFTTKSGAATNKGYPPFTQR